MLFLLILSQESIASSENPPANINVQFTFRKNTTQNEKIIDITKRMLTTLFAKLYISF